MAFTVTINPPPVGGTATAFTPTVCSGSGTTIILTGYTGSIPEGSEIAKLAETLQDPWKLPETKGSLADDMRIKLLYDLAYTASLERFDTFLRTELGIIFKTPLVMLKMTQGR